MHETRRSRWQRWLTATVGLALGLSLFAAAGLSGAQAQDDEVVVGGGASLAEGATAADIEALVNSILAEILGEAAVADDGASVDDGTTGGDFNVGGNMGGSVTSGGGSGGGISIGGGSGGSGSESGG